MTDEQEFAYQRVVALRPEIYRQLGEGCEHQWHQPRDLFIRNIEVCSRCTLLRAEGEQFEVWGQKLENGELALQVRPAEKPPAEQEVVRVADDEKQPQTGDEEDEPVQVALFEGKPVHRLQLALGGAGAMSAPDKELHNGDEITVTVRAKVVTVRVHEGAKVTTRKATARVLDDPTIDLA